MIFQVKIALNSYCFENNLKSFFFFNKMNRINSISTHIVKSSPTENASLELNQTITEIHHSVPTTLMEKIITSLPNLLASVWVFSPSICLYKLYTGSFDTKLNLILVLIYQYFFHRKTHMLRELYGSLKCYKFFKEYRLVFEEPIKNIKLKEALFPFHPHGVACWGMNLATQNHPVFKDAEVVGSRMSFEMPWGGLVMKFYGVEGANPENFTKMMNDKKNLIFLPGGFEEATLTVYGKDRVFIKHRKGFIKLALEYGYTIYPCYTFGESLLYYTYSNEKLGLFLNKFKMPGVIPYTKTGVLPIDDVRLITVIGKGIKIPIIPNPTQEHVNQYHKLYVDSLIAMYDKYKNEFGGCEKLEVL